MYRCPYCHEEMGEEKLPQCPKCGKSMRYALRRTPAQRREDKRKLRLMEKNALRKKSAFDVEKATSFLRSPRKAIWAVFILAMLGFLLFRASQHTDTQREDVALALAERQLNVMATALARYHFHTDEWPSNEAGLNALIADDGAPGWFGPYLNDPRRLPVKKLPLDPWKQQYVYSLTNDVVLLFSKGSDMVAGTADDVRPDPKSFVLTDMSWTNEWVSAEERLPIRVRVMPQER